VTEAGQARVVLEIIGALNAGDVDGVLAHIDPEFEWLPLEDSPAAGPHRGHEEVRRYVEDWLAAFPALRLDVEELSEHGAHVVAVVRGRARGKVSGVELANHFCQVWTLRDGAALRMREYATREQALDALG
jgi:ketosteroid isomerase-like protein